MKKLLLPLLVVLLVGAYFVWNLYNDIYSDNITGDETIEFFIPSDSSFDRLIDSFETNDVLIDIKGFKNVAKMMKFTNVKPGKFLIQPSFNNRELIGLLRSGNQTPIKFTFNNVRTIKDLAGRFAERLESDSMAFINAFTDSVTLDKHGYTSENVLSTFIPNTYEFYWNATPEQVFDKMRNESKKFWNEERTSKLNQTVFTKKDVYTLASIIQKETNRNSEKPIMAGVYINRIQRGIPLQADPTVVFAVGDFGIRRVLNKHIAIDSPYNTYKNTGLPPGPICMPDISSIDAVLNYEKHKYLYFCASPSEAGGHVFAKTLKEHNRNANAYRRWLNKRKIFE